MTDKEFIEKLNTGERYIIPESDYGKAEIWRINDIYLLFEVPLYGGAPVLHNTYSLHEVDSILNAVNGWS